MKILREETRIITQAALKDKKDMDPVVFLVKKSRINRILEIFEDPMP